MVFNTKHNDLSTVSTVDYSLFGTEATCLAHVLDPSIQLITDVYAQFVLVFDVAVCVIENQANENK